MALWSLHTFLLLDMSSKPWDCTMCTSSSNFRWESSFNILQPNFIIESWNVAKQGLSEFWLKHSNCPKVSSQSIPWIRLKLLLQDTPCQLSCFHSKTIFLLKSPLAINGPFLSRRYSIVQTLISFMYYNSDYMASSHAFGVISLYSFFIHEGILRVYH